MAEWLKAQLFNRLIFGIAGSNPAEGMQGRSFVYYVQRP
jgi:hypothetical protein